ncbi:MAG: CRISPR-associated endonuclease Cas1 [Hyphomicrobiales bacterium]|nr:CRISPR-associated endonuclease Cas1 [Hyphomicrobiales bacterium]
MKWQEETRADPRRRMEFSIDLVTRKIEGCIKTLEKCVRRSAAWEIAMERAYADLTRLECDPPSDIVSLRALEAGSAAAYFRGLARRGAEMDWHRPQAYSRVMEDDRPTDFLVSACRQP